MAEAGRSTIESMLPCASSRLSIGRNSVGSAVCLYLADFIGDCHPGYLRFKWPSPVARGDFQMSTTADATASLPDDPALLRIDDAIATITLNRPAAFNSIDLSIAKRLEQLGAEVEASSKIKVL